MSPSPSAVSANNPAPACDTKHSPSNGTKTSATPFSKPSRTLPRAGPPGARTPNERSGLDVHPLCRYRCESAGLSRGEAIRQYSAAMTLRSQNLLTLTVAMIAVGSVVAGLLGSVIGGASLSQHGELYLWLFVLSGVATAAYFLIRLSPVGNLDINRLYIVPVSIMIAATSLLANGIGGVLPHQVAWGSLGLIFGFAALLATGAIRLCLPPWLMAYAGIGIVLQLTETFGSGPVFDVGLSTIALFVMWMVANALNKDGGVMKFMVPFAIGYWVVTALGVIVHFTHFSIGSMTALTVEMPWQGGLKNVLTTGDYTGYGFIGTQTGREASFIVCAYHFVAWRYDRRRAHGYLAALAFALFLTGYGRVPLIGGAIGFGLILLSNERGTRFWKIAVSVVVVVGLATSTGLVSKFTNLSARRGTRTAAADTGHLSLWSQHLGLFLEQPLTGVGSNATEEQTAETRVHPIIHDSDPLPTEALSKRGSRGEGGWTGLLAQRGVINGGIILALIALAVTYCFGAFPTTQVGKQDMTLVRAFVAASLIFFITDVAPFSVYSVTAYVLGQVTMIAAVRAIEASQRAPARQTLPYAAGARRPVRNI